MEEVHRTRGLKDWNIVPLEVVGGYPLHSILFYVKAAHDAHLALLSTDAICSPMIEIELGSRYNTRNIIRLNETLPNKVDVETHGIFSENEFLCFAILFRSNLIEVYAKGVSVPFMSWENCEDPFQVTHFAYTTALGAVGEWVFIDGGICQNIDDDFEYTGEKDWESTDEIEKKVPELTNTIVAKDEDQEDAPQESIEEVTSQDLGDTFRVSLKADLNPINTNTDGEAQELETETGVAKPKFNGFSFFQTTLIDVCQLVIMIIICLILIIIGINYDGEFPWHSMECRNGTDVNKMSGEDMKIS